MSREGSGRGRRLNHWRGDEQPKKRDDDKQGDALHDNPPLTLGSGS